MNELNDTIKHYETLAKDYNHDMLISVIDFAKMGLKASFILNGSAAISVLTLFTKALIELPEISSSILDAVFIFALGALSSSIAVILSYFTQLAYQKSCAINTTKPIYALLNYMPKKENILYETDNNDEESDVNEKNGDWLRILAIIMVVLSFVAFFVGIYTTKNAFNDIELSNKQIFFLDTSYPNVDIKPL